MFRRDRLWVFAVLVVMVTSVPSLLLAGERILQVRTTEDPALVDRGLCAALPFAANVLLGATVWSHRTRAADGAVVNEQVRQVGTAAACARITDFSFPPFGSPPSFSIRCRLDDGAYAGLGTCTVTSNDVPVPLLILAGCTLRLVEFPGGVLGRSLTSATVFNPFRVAGFDTGSFWTLRLYTRD